jgi:hypothetical protein
MASSIFKTQRTQSILILSEGSIPVRFCLRSTKSVTVVCCTSIRHSYRVLVVTLTRIYFISRCKWSVLILASPVICQRLGSPALNSEKRPDETQAVGDEREVRKLRDIGCCNIAMISVGLCEWPMLRRSHTNSLEHEQYLCLQKQL